MATGAGTRCPGRLTGKYAEKTNTPGDLLSTGRIELAEVTGVGYAPSQASPEAAALYLPIQLLPPVEHTLPDHKRPRLSATAGAELTERLRRESLRDLAAEYDVSHETIRQAADRAWRERLAAL